MTMSFQCFGDHDWTQIRATDTDIYDCFNRLTSIAQPLSRPHFIAESTHLLSNETHIGHDIVPIDQNTGGIVHVSKCDMKDRTPFSHINGASIEHKISTLGQLRLICKSL